MQRQVTLINLPLAGDINFQWVKECKMSSPSGDQLNQLIRQMFLLGVRVL